MLSFALAIAETEELAPMIAPPWVFAVVAASGPDP